MAILQASSQLRAGQRSRVEPGTTAAGERGGGL